MRGREGQGHLPGTGRPEDLEHREREGSEREREGEGQVKGRGGR